MRSFWAESATVVLWYIQITYLEFFKDDLLDQVNNENQNSNETWEVVV